MIPMQCPKCGRRGRVPPDRLNSRLHCKKCHAIFHLDMTGKLVMGEPGGSEKKSQPKVRKEVDAGPLFDPFEAWEKLPKAQKLAIPLVPLTLLALVYLSPLGFGGGTSTDHLDRGERIAQALASGDKSTVTGLATRGTAEDAGKWFDLARAQIDKAKLGAGAAPSASLLAGDPAKADVLTLSACVGDVLTDPKDPKFETFDLCLRREGGRWALDGKETLAAAERMATASASPGAARGKR